MTKKPQKFTIRGEERIKRYVKILKDKLKRAKSEEDIRLKSTQVFAVILDELGITYEDRHEVTLLSGGRADSIFNNVIIEYKSPGLFDKKRGIKEAVGGKDEKNRGLVDYIIGFSIELSSDEESLKESIAKKVGVGFDGKTFVFVRYIEDEAKEIHINSSMKRDWCPDFISGTFEVTVYKELKEGLRRFLLYIRSLGRIPLNAENLLKRFGADSRYCRKHLKKLYKKLIDNEDESHVKTLYGEWSRLFGIIYGDVDTATTQVKKEMKDVYGVTNLSDIKIRKFIFTIHTYYSIILKILVSELLASLLNPFRNGRELHTLSRIDFQQHIADIVKGKRFKTIGVENFFEGGFFEWYLYVWDKEIEETIKEALSLLKEMETTTSVIKPEGVQDMIRVVYQDIMPQGLRHLLGEYFTPDWLAEYTIETVGFTGSFGENTLDPGCGSGTFLTNAIKLKRLANKSKKHKEVIKNILSTVVGFDLNPISVISSKTNYLLAMGDVLELGMDIKIPVYMCDSILTPTVHAKQKKERKIVEIKNTFVGDFKVPAFDKREDVDELLDLIANCIEDEFTIHEFELKIKEKRYPEEHRKQAIELFKAIAKLEVNGRNGVWACLLKNSFAPVYSHHEFDYVIGNPPWISWRNMSKTYRDSTLPIWKSYDIFTKDAYNSMTTHDDFAMAFTYVSADQFLKPTGKLGFVISQAFFKSAKGGEGFRKFEITREGAHESLKAESVDDMVALKPFKGVSNRTSVFILKKGDKTAYPVPYRLWKKKKGVRSIEPHLNLDDVKRRTEVIDLMAIPINENPRSPWLTVHKSMLSSARKLLGVSYYSNREGVKPRKGVEPLGAKGIYVLREPIQLDREKLQIVNNLNRGRLEKIERMGEHVGRIEPDFVFPMISGRNIRRWGLESTAYILMPHVNAKGPHNAVSETDLKVKYTETFKWLKHFRDILFETRMRNGKFFDKDKDPFYALDNVGTYTFAPYKVVWREQQREMVACVVSKRLDKPLKGKLIIPDSKVLFCTFWERDEAHYLCAVLNSLPVRYIIENYTIETQRGLDILHNIKIPQYDPKNKHHKTLAKLSLKAHKEFPNDEKIAGIENQIDQIVFKMFNLDFKGIKHFYLS